MLYRILRNKCSEINCSEIHYKSGRTNLIFFSTVTGLKVKFENNYSYKNGKKEH